MDSSLVSQEAAFCWGRPNFCASAAPVAPPRETILTPSSVQGLAKAGASMWPCQCVFSPALGRERRSRLGVQKRKG